MDGEVGGSSGWERPRKYVRDEVVGSQDDREIEGELLEEKVPADDFGGLGMADEHKISMIRVHNEVGPFEKVVELGDGVDNGEAFQLLNLPTSLHVRQALGDELYGSELGVNNLEENRANARSGGVGVEIDGVAIVQIEILDRAANEGLQSVEGGSSVFSVNHVSGSTSREELGQPLGVV